MANWADLPWDLLERISNSCIIHDHMRMQYVCKSWSSILKKKSCELPLLMLPKEEEEDADARDFCSISKQKIHTVHLPEMRGKRCCGSFQNGWLMIVDDKLDIFLFHPWSKKRIDLPNYSTFEHKNRSAEEIRDVDILKAAVSDDGKVVVIVYGVGFLAFCRVGDDAYTEIDKNEAIVDVIYHKGKFYLLTEMQSIYLLHLEDGSPPHFEKLAVNSEADSIIHRRIFGYLVPDILIDSMFVIAKDSIFPRDIDFDEEDDQEEDLFLVLVDTNRLDVFSVILEDGSHDKTLKRFRKVESLGDRVLFLGHNSPIVVMASQFPGFKGNRICYTNNGEHVFSLEDYTLEDLYWSLFDSSLFAGRSYPTMPFMDCNPSLFILVRFLKREVLTSLYIVSRIFFIVVVINLLLF